MEKVKFKTYEPKKRDETVYFRIEHDIGVPTIVACYADGRLYVYGSIAHITPEGKLCLRRDCDIPGIQTDSFGRILLAD